MWLCNQFHVQLSFFQFVLSFKDYFPFLVLILFLEYVNIYTFTGQNCIDLIKFQCHSTGFR